MKKLLTVLLTLLMVFTLVGCNSKEDTPVVQEPEKQEEVVEQTKEEPEIVGDYIDIEDGTLTDGLKDIFNKALEGLLGATYEPQELVATQVVAGTNYKFLANGTKTTNPITKGTYYIYVNKDLQGNVSLLDIETIEEKQEEVKEEIEDYTGVKFWVVVYDQFGNEVSRTTATYGTTIKDPDGNDVLVDHNKYFNTTINYPSPEKDDEPAPSPAPSCEYAESDSLIYIVKKESGYYLTFRYTYDEGSYVFKDCKSILLEELGSEYNEGDWIHLEGNFATALGTCCENGHGAIIPEDCVSTDLIIEILQAKYGGYRWRAYSYDYNSQKWNEEPSKSNTTAGNYSNIVSGLIVGHFYHVSGNFPTWKAQCTYTDCQTYMRDHEFNPS